MARFQACSKCGTKLDVSNLQPGQAFSCGSCGHVLRAGGGGGAAVPPVASPPVPPPMPRRPAAPARGGGAPTRRRGGGADPETRARMGAAKLCASAMYAGILSIILLFVPFFGGLMAIPAALAAIIMGIVGLARLGSVGLGYSGHDATPHERVAAKMARRSKPQAVIGIVLGIALIALPVLLYVMAKKEQEERQRRFNEIFNNPQFHIEEEYDR